MMARMPRATISKDMLTVGAVAPPKAPKDYGQPLNFRVPPDFVRYFKITAAHLGMNQTELLMHLCSPALKKHGYE